MAELTVWRFGYQRLWASAVQQVPDCHGSPRRVAVAAAGKPDGLTACRPVVRPNLSRWPEFLQIAATM